MWCGPIQAGGSRPQPPPRLYAVSDASEPLGNREGTQTTLTRKPGDLPCQMKPAVGDDGFGGTKMKKFLTAALALCATPALAHHPLGGLPMETFTHGLLSGVGHPVLGFDHLFFVVAVGVLALFTANRLMAPAAYIAAMLVGCGLMYAGIAMPLAELVIVASLLVGGGLLAMGRTASPAMIIAVFAVFGLFHGSAFGGSIAGQEGGIGGGVLLGYLIGLGAVQYVIAIAAGWAVEKFGATSVSSVNARLVGAAIAGVGIFLGLEVIEGPIVEMLTAA